MNKFYLLTIIFFLYLSYGCTLKKGETCFGKYTNKKDFIIKLNSKNRAFLIKYDRKHSSGGHNIFKILSEGSYKLSDDSIVIIRFNNNRFYLKFINPEVLVNFNLPYLNKFDTLYQTEKYHMEKLYSFGQWVNGKKDGEWIIYEKYFTISIIYKNGFIKQYNIVRKNLP